MTHVQTDDISLAFSHETMLGTAGTAWTRVEPNEISNASVSITRAARTPISVDRQPRKPFITGLTSGIEFQHSATMDVFDDFLEAAVRAVALNSEMKFHPSGVVASSDAYTVAGLTATQADKLKFSTGEFATLVYARGFTNAANNGLKVLDADATTADTSISVAGDLVDETPPASSRVELAGVRLLDANTDLVFAAVGTTMTITEQGGIAGFSWASFGLRAGQAVYVGTYGFARIKTITSTILTLDIADATLLAGATVTALNGATTVDIYFGKHIKNANTDSADYLDRSHHFEIRYPGIGTLGVPLYEYSIGNVLNTFNVEMPSAGEATVSLAFVGIDTEAPVEARKTGADVAKQPLRLLPLATMTSDLARLRIADVDETGLTTDFRSFSFSINNNATAAAPDLGQETAKYINTGVPEYSISAEITFNDDAVIARVRSGATVSANTVLKNGDGAVMIDFPSLALSEGAKSFSRGESVMVSLNGGAFKDEAFLTTINASLFPYIPA